MKDETKDEKKKRLALAPFCALPFCFFWGTTTHPLFVSWSVVKKPIIVVALSSTSATRNTAAVVTTSVTFLRAKRENVRLNHENCVFGWNRGFFHVREWQRYARCVVRAFVFLERSAFFFSLSRIERCACDCASLRVGERGGIGEQKKIDSGRGARRANDRGSMRWNVNEYRRVIHSNLRLFRDRWTWDCTSRARDGLFFSLFARLYSSRENL